ncbi:MAG: hypothetical protein FWG34_08175 [Oscillospiraceae bacterium]|nr:hypothetical protein [Oscillospiraceae bacterium]
MKNKKELRIFWLSIFAVLAALTVALASCADKPDAGGSENQGAQDAGGGEHEGDGETQAGIDKRQAVLDMYQNPGEDFGGHKFRIMLREEEYYNAKDMYTEEESGEPVNDAVYKRRMEVENMLNMNFAPLWVPYGSQPAAIKKSVLAQDGAYEAIITSFDYSYQAAKSGYFADLALIAGLDLSKPWWDQNIMQETSVMNKIYYATGDITVVDNDGTWLMMFNKDMQKSFGLPDIYEIVKNGEWTLDTLTELSKGVTLDLNGDGKIGKDDQVGMATTSDSIRSFFFSTGSRILRKDANDVPYFAFDSENVLANFEKIYEIFRGADNFVMLADDIGGWTVTQAAFLENRALFYAEVMFHLSSLRNMDTDFGVVPLPKANKEQADYCTNIHRYASAAASIPIGASDEDNRRAAVILEAMAYEGFKYLTPAYYDISLKTKYARDDDSSEMLDLILAGRSADLGYVGNLGGFLEAIVSDVVGKKAALASTIEKNLPKLNTELEKIIEIYENLP